jgi:hypothetical protein
MLKMICRGFTDAQHGVLPWALSVWFIETTPTESELCIHVKEANEVTALGC